MQMPSDRSLLRPLAQQLEDQQQLPEQKNQPAEDIPSIRLCHRGLAIEHDAARWQVPFLEAPSLQRSPIEQVYIRTRHNRNVLRLCAAKDLHNVFARKPPLRSKTAYITSHRSLPHQPISQYTYWCLCSADNQRKRLRRRYEPRSSTVFINGAKQDDRMGSRLSQPRQEGLHRQPAQIGESQFTFIATQTLMQ